MTGSSTTGIKKLAVGFGAVLLLATSFATAGAIATGQTATEELDTPTSEEQGPAVQVVEPVDDVIHPVVVELVEDEADSAEPDVVDLTEEEADGADSATVELAELQTRDIEAIVDDSEDSEDVAPIVCTLRGDSITDFRESAGATSVLNAQSHIDFTVPLSLPAGEYSLSAESADAYVGRELDSQPTEQWFVEFLAADGSVLATSSSTSDVPDLVRSGTWSGSVGNVTLSADVQSVRIVHATPGSPSQNSVQPVCLSAVAEVVVGGVQIVEEPPGESTEVIEEQPDPVEMPAAVADDPVVLTVVDSAPIAQSQPANPSFTG